MTTPSQLLKRYWGYDTFRPGQEEIINSILTGVDTLALLPTGGGKSVCYQIPALLNEGLCIVVSPLIALMRDQVMHLHSRGIAAEAIYSGLSKSDIDRLLDKCIYGSVKLLYVSPERIQTEEFTARITQMKVSLIAIDEAHCISQWGYDFRPAYMQIISLRELLPTVPMIALTASATPTVVGDIQEKLQFKDGKVYQRSFARSALSYVVRAVPDKQSALVDIIRKTGGSSIVYVRSRKRCRDVAEYLSRYGIGADYYHAGLDADTRSQRQADWQAGRLPVIVCTNAFGMGIDKANVRAVIHLDPPSSIEAYYQEAGRAGRDGLRAFAVVLTTTADIHDLKTSTRQDYPSYEEIATIYDYLCSDLQIAYDMGGGMRFDFDLSVFAKKYKYSAYKVIHAFTFLEAQGWLRMNDGFMSRPQVHVTAHREVLYKFQLEHQQYDPLLKMLLRTCTGIFEGYVTFDEGQIARKIDVSVADTTAALGYLDSINILSYIPRTRQPGIELLRHRTRKEMLALDRVYIERRIAEAQQRSESVIGYLSQQEHCRGRYLLHYFGEENTTDCGICDVCIGNKKKAATLTMGELSSQITNTLTEPLTIKAISIKLYLPIDKIAEVIMMMSEAGMVTRSEDGRVCRK